MTKQSLYEEGYKRDCKEYWQLKKGVVGHEDANIFEFSGLLKKSYPSFDNNLKKKKNIYDSNVADVCGKAGRNCYFKNVMSCLFLWV